jgi:hypothetical protein
MSAVQTRLIASVQELGVEKYFAPLLTVTRIPALN